MNEFSEKKWFSTREVAEITGLHPMAVIRACNRGEIDGAYRLRQGRGSSPWRIPSAGAQFWFDVVRGLRRPTDAEMAIGAQA